MNTHKHMLLLYFDYPEGDVRSSSARCRECPPPGRLCLCGSPTSSARLVRWMSAGVCGWHSLQDELNKQNLAAWLPHELSPSGQINLTCVMMSLGLFCVYITCMVWYSSWTCAARWCACVFGTDDWCNWHVSVCVCLPQAGSGFTIYVTKMWVCDCRTACLAWWCDVRGGCVSVCCEMMCMFFWDWWLMQLKCECVCVSATSRLRLFRWVVGKTYYSYTIMCPKLPQKQNVSDTRPVWSDGCDWKKDLLEIVRWDTQLSRAGC